MIRAIEGQIVSDDSWLPEPESVRGGVGPYIIPIVDDVYGGVIAWANTSEQAERIVASLNAKAVPDFCACGRELHADGTCSNGGAFCG